MKAKDLMTGIGSVNFVYADASIKDAAEAFAKCRFTMIPVLEKGSNRYLYSISSTDVLRYMAGIRDIKEAEEDNLSSLPLSRLIAACSLEADIESIADLIANQNYVPCVNSEGVFVGLVTRKSLIFMLLGELEKRKNNA